MGIENSRKSGIRFYGCFHVRAFYRPPCNQADNRRGGWKGWAYRLSWFPSIANEAQDLEEDRELHTAGGDRAVH